MRKAAIFISGTGSNMMAALESHRHLVACVVSSNPLALGVTRAKRQKIPVIIFNKNDSWAELSENLRVRNVDFIFLAGFMRILPKEFVRAWENKIVNVHPSLLPAYPGLKSIERAFQEGQNTGVTIHFVDEGVDSGKIILQQEVLLQKDLETTEFFIHVTEHNLVRKMFEMFERGEL